ncbi:MAG: alpha/beta hydrolase [Ktedonobacteraceae bacterium]
MKTICLLELAKPGQNLRLTLFGHSYGSLDKSLALVGQSSIDSRKPFK